MSNSKSLSSTKVMSSVEIVDIINKVRQEENNKEGNLKHDAFLKLIRTTIGEKESIAFQGRCEIGINLLKFCYFLPRRECTLVIAGESYKARLKIYYHWKRLEEEKNNVIEDNLNPKSDLSYTECLEGVEIITRLLRLPEQDVIKLIQDVNTSFSIPFELPKLVQRPNTSFSIPFELPKLVQRPNTSFGIPLESPKLVQSSNTSFGIPLESPKLVQSSNTSFGSYIVLPKSTRGAVALKERETFNATQALKESGLTLSARAFNNILVVHGYLEVINVGITPYKVVTKKGLPYGKNISSLTNPAVTQPLWYKDTFEDLLEEISYEAI